MVSKVSNKCGSCNGPILNICSLPGERLVFKHSEPYCYPNGPPGSKWSITKITSRERDVYYHATAHCMFRRFRQEYVMNSNVTMGSGVAAELAQYPLDFNHPDI